MDDKPSRSRKVRRPPSGPSSAMWAMTGLWIEMLASILGLGLLGFGIDRWVGWFPALTITGIILGVIGGLYNAVKKAMLIQYPKTKKQDEKGHE